MSVFALLLVLILSALIIKVGSIALRMTGLDKETAAFQALSAYTGTGFTTSEAENIVNHRERRKIVKMLMILGNIGIVSGLAMLYISFRGDSFSNALAKLGLLGLVLIVVLAFPVAKGLDNVVDRFITRRLSKMTHFSMGAFSEIIKLASGYGIAELLITDSHLLAGKKLMETDLSQSNILILAIKRGFHMIPTPKADQQIRAGDKLLCFGYLKGMSDLVRKDGDPE
ncbi:MAG: TrkA C-terminal domain-containing protein [Candidatus Krumholzibacteriota bacterium]|nr:TrkA C-terminal domain-containing protein [Candidatus Krumholzibacteriota bacterium]